MGRDSCIWRFVEWLPALAGMTAIFMLSSVPGSSLPGGYSTVAHFGEYFVLAAALTIPLRRMDWTLAALLAICLASAYGITDEFHQHFVPLRTPDPVDWLVDTIGASVAVVVVYAARAAFVLKRRDDQRRY